MGTSLLKIKNFLGMNTTRRNLPPQQAREIQDLVSERGLTKTRSGFGKYNVTAQSGAILGIFDYRRKNGQKGYLFADANGDWREWEYFHFGSGWFWNPDLEVFVEGGWSDGWTVSYEANELPTAADPVWTLFAGNDQSNCSVSNSILTLGYAPDPDTAFVFYYRLGDAADNAIGNMLEAKVKGVTLPANKYQALGINDGTKGAVVYIYSDKIRCPNNDEEYVMDTTDDYHTYKITLKGTDFLVYVDDVLRITAVPSNTVTDRFSFGIDDTEQPTICLWDYVRYYTGGF